MFKFLFKSKILGFVEAPVGVLNTIDALPRTPNSAGIIPVKFKRKLSYKNSHMVQYVSVQKIIKALQTLKRLGHRYYQFVIPDSDFERRDRVRSRTLDSRI